MKVISIRQPWASLIESGRKSIELRSWTTDYRGPLVVAAGGRPWNGPHGHEVGPTGVLICRVNLIDVVPFDRRRHAKASACSDEILDSIASDKLFAWILREPTSIQKTPFKGSLGLREFTL